MMQTRVHVQLKDSVHDPAGAAVARSLREQGLEAVEGIRIGRTVELVLDTDSPARARLLSEQAAEVLLANPVIERWQVEVLQTDDPGQADA